ncbi:MAG TPA: AzlD domain-containing protein [Burkholderiaceae bacterium]|jgi:branched-subunit amino acid transport protein AzlD|nr:AzlD domain-containing protein [Burkholderiaceae bacterium]
MDKTYLLTVIAAMGAVTFGLRALPFLSAQWLRRSPVVQHLGRFLPLAIMVLLLVHSAGNSAREHATGPWPELLAVALTALLQWRSRNPLLSIVAGTAVYVAMRNWN